MSSTVPTMRPAGSGRSPRAQWSGPALMSVHGVSLCGHRLNTVVPDHPRRCGPTPEAFLVGARGGPSPSKERVRTDMNEWTDIGPKVLVEGASKRSIVRDCGLGWDSRSSSAEGGVHQVGDDEPRLGCLVRCGCQEPRPSSSRHEPALANETAELVARRNWAGLGRRCAAASSYPSAGSAVQGSGADDVRCIDRRIR